MTERTRFKITPAALILIGISWLGLLVAAVFVVVGGFHCFISNDPIGVLIALAEAAFLFGWYYVTATLAGNLITNYIKGYKPWEWGMVARTDAGRATQSLGIGVTFAQVFANFSENQSGDNLPSA